MQLSDPMLIKCKRCGYIQEVSADSFEDKTFCVERSMGAEIEHYYSCTFECRNCQLEITIEVSGFEYPAGAFNFDNANCQGGEVLNKPTWRFEYELKDEDELYVYDECIAVENYLQQAYETEINTMSPREFELFIAQLFEKMGYSVKVTPQTHDNGFDVIATKNGLIPFTIIVECKHYATNRPVGIDVIRSISCAREEFEANAAVVVTSSRFTRGARRFAEKHNNLMHLMDISDLVQIMCEQNY